jgi:hypothetical protein
MWEPRAFAVTTVAGKFEVFGGGSKGSGMNWEVAQLLALAVNAEGNDIEAKRPPVYQIDRVDQMLAGCRVRAGLVVIRVRVIESSFGMPRPLRAETPAAS